MEESMSKIEFNRQLAYSITCRQLGKFEKASQLLDELANAMLYQASHPQKSLDDCLFIVRSFKKFGRENAALISAGVRCDRENHFMINYKQELLELLPDDRNIEDNSKIVDKVFSLIAAIRSNKKLLTALQKNCSNQYINRVLSKDTTLCFLTASKAKRFFQLYYKLF